MGVLLGRLLAGANLLVGVAGAARGLQLYGELPISCNVPLRFGLWGEVLVSSGSKQAFLLFPVTSLLLAFSPTLCRYFYRLEMPTWVKDADRYRMAYACAADLVVLATGSLMLAVTEQAPRIARNEQQSLLPEGLVMGYLTTLGVIYGAFYYGAKYFAG